MKKHVHQSISKNLNALHIILFQLPISVPQDHNVRIKRNPFFHTISKKTNTIMFFNNNISHNFPSSISCDFLPTRTIRTG